jgi:para-nitrobenzyl esterase
MAGNTGDEFFEFIRAENDEQFKELAAKYFGEAADEFLSHPEANIHCDQGYAPVSAPEMGVKAAFLGENKFDDAKPCYYYRFIPDIPGDDHPGTFHSVDLWFFFETLAKDARPFEGRHYDIARQMCDYWANFIKTGDPNGYDINGNKLPEWRRYTDADRSEMEFTPDGAAAGVENSSFTKFLLDHVK